jgi:hypothetical protein
MHLLSLCAHARNTHAHVTHGKRTWSHRWSGPRRGCHGARFFWAPSEMKKGLNVFGGPKPYVCMHEHILCAQSYVAKLII